MSKLRYLLLNLPNPIGRNIYRGFAGGFGTLGSIKSEILLPIYLLYGASALKQAGVEYEVIEAQALRYNSSEVAGLVAKKKPEVLICWLSLPSLYSDLRVIEEIKKNSPNTFVIALGAVCNVMPEEILLNSSVDIVVKGRYPHYNAILNIANAIRDKYFKGDVFKEINGAIYRENGKIISNSREPCQENLDNLNFETYYQIPIQKYISRFEGLSGFSKCIPIVTAVGCPYPCIYCPYPIGYGKKRIEKSIKRILDEIEFLKYNFDISGFVFRDQDFPNDKKRVLEFCDELIKKDLRISWLTEARADHISEEIIFKMKEAGCFRIHLGVETGARELLNSVGKPGLTVEAIENAFMLAKKAGVYTVAHIIIGLPGENEETLNETLDLLYAINPDAVNLNIITPYPGTKLFEIAREEGWISTLDWSRYTSYDAIMQTKDLSIEQLYAARKKMKYKFMSFKLKSDPKYRRLFVKNLPMKIFRRMLDLGREFIG